MIKAGRTVAVSQWDAHGRFGLRPSGTAASVGSLTGARNDEAGMISGTSATGHEIGGTLGIAIYAHDRSLSKA